MAGLEALLLLRVSSLLTMPIAFQGAVSNKNWDRVSRVCNLDGGYKLVSVRPMTAVGRPDPVGTEAFQCCRSSTVVCCYVCVALIIVAESHLAQSGCLFTPGVLEHI